MLPGMEKFLRVLRGTYDREAGTDRRDDGCILVCLKRVWGAPDQSHLTGTGYHVRGGFK